MIPLAGEKTLSDARFKYGAFDQPTYYIDLTPFLHILCAGPANISLTIKGPDPSHHVNENWFVSGNVQVFLGRTNERTTGKLAHYAVERFAQTVTSSDVSADKQEAKAFILAYRQLHIESNLAIDGQHFKSVFEQQHSFSNTQHYLDGGAYEVSLCEGH
jgi:hypothetical protein